MFQTTIPLNPDLTQDERLAIIRKAYNEGRSQMTLMLAHKLRVSEVESVHALEGDAARELDFSRWEEIIRGWELASVFAFRKPSHLDGHESLSFQFLDKRGSAAFKVFLNFGGHDPSTEIVQAYNNLIECFTV